MNRAISQRLTAATAFKPPVNINFFSDAKS